MKEKVGREKKEERMDARRNAAPDISLLLSSFSFFLFPLL
jgi:hypothetical protein